MKRFFALLMAALLMISVAGCGEEESQVFLPTDPTEETRESAGDLGELVILFTGGLNGVYARDAVQGAVGYAAFSSYANQLKNDDQTVILIDGGSSVDVRAAKEFWDVVDACDYDIRVPGALELSGSIKNLKELAENRGYISCNLIDLTDRTPVFDPYVLVEVDGLKVGFVGVTKPVFLGKKNYQVLGLDDGQLLRDTVQQAVDDAADAGADYVIVVGNLGTNPADSPCTTAEVIAGITGMVAWLDCGSGAVLDGDVVTDKDDFEIPVCAPGDNFRYVGQMILDLNNGKGSMKLLSQFQKEDRSILTLIDKMDED